MFHIDVPRYYQFGFCSDLGANPRHCSSVYIRCCGNGTVVTFGLQQQADKRANGPAARPQTFHSSLIGT